MQRHKSRRHVHAANVRWRQERAQAERDAGISDREPVIDARPVISLDLSGVGGRSLVLEPRLGFIAYRARDAATGEVLECAALKELLHRIADRLPRTMAPRECT